MLLILQGHFGNIDGPGWGVEVGNCELGAGSWEARARRQPGGAVK